MLSIFLLLSITGGQASQNVAQYNPCVWPNTCSQEQVSQISTCQWPNPCLQQAEAIGTCQLPNKCG